MKRIHTESHLEQQGSRKGTALMEARNNEPPYIVTRNVGTCRASRRTIGAAAGEMTNGI